MKLVNDEHKRLTYERKKHLDKIEQTINLNKEEDPYFGSLVDEFNKRFKGRIIRYKNSNYVIKHFDRSEKNIKALMLYDSNGIKVNEQYHDKMKLYNSIELNDLFENFFILSKDESLIIMDEFIKDNKNFIKIYFQMQTDKRYPIEKDLIPYKIEPSYIDINEYNLTIQTNTIKHVENKENNVFVIFDSVLIGDAKSTGFVSSSSIKVYTTLYSKDIINILHIHLNDTSLDITIDSEFLEKKIKLKNIKYLL